MQVEVNNNIPEEQYTLAEQAGFSRDAITNIMINAADDLNDMYNSTYINLATID